MCMHTHIHFLLLCVYDLKTDHFVYVQFKKKLLLDTKRIEFVICVFTIKF